MKAIATVALVLVLAGCSYAPSQGAQDAPKPTMSAEPTNSVQWGDYSPDLKGRIDDLGAAADCRGLQEQFDIADQNSSITLDRTGHGNAELMKYIYAAQESAGCF